MTVLVLADIAYRWFRHCYTTPALVLILSLVIAVVMFCGSTLGGTLVFDYGFNVENSTDHPVWHVNERDVMPGDPH